MKLLFTWLDAHSWSYTALAAGSVLLVLVWLWRSWSIDPLPRRTLGWKEWTVTGVLLLLVLLAWRWPALLEIHSDGVREAQLLSGARAMAGDLVPYRSPDLGASGWVAAAALMPAYWAGLPADYFVARVIGLLMDWVALWLGYGLLRRFILRGYALGGVIPVALLIATPHVPIFYQYTGWHAALLLTMVTASLLMRAGKATDGGIRPILAWMAAAFCLALIPWTTRGAVWLALGMWAVSVAVERRFPSGSRVSAVRTGGLALYGNAAIVCFLHGVGQWERFWAGYVCGSALEVSRESPSLPVVTLLLLLVAVTALWVALWFGSRSVKAGRAILVALTLAAGALQLGAGVPAIFGRFAEYWRRPHSEVATRILAQSKPGDFLAVWGMRPQLYVETGIPQAVTSVVTSGEIRSDNPWRDSYRRRFLAEFAQRKPVYFVDAGGAGLPGSTGRQQEGHEDFPALREHVRGHFRLVSDDGQIRLYQRHERKSDEDDPSSATKLLSIEDIKVVQSTAAVTAMDDMRWFAHAPCTFVVAKPDEATRIQGSFGFVEDAYADPASGTDGATFIIEVRGKDYRGRLLEQRLEPVTRTTDRGKIPFKIDLPHGEGWEVEFIIESGKGNAKDWTFWRGLRFD